MWGVVDDLWWRDEDADYIRRRSDRYPGAKNIEPDWTLVAAGGVHAGVTAWKSSGVDLREYEGQG